MTKNLAIGLVAAVGLLSGLIGCAPTVQGSNNGRREGRMYGDYGVWASSSYNRIEGGSLINKLSIIGDKNTIVVEDDVAMAKIEIWGSGNDIELPYGLNPYFTQVGKDNLVHNRPAPWGNTPTTSVETTRTRTVVDVDENGNATVSTTPSETPRAPSRATPTPAPKPAEKKTQPTAEPTNPDAVP